MFQCVFGGLRSVFKGCLKYAKRPPKFKGQCVPLNSRSVSWVTKVLSSGDISDFKSVSGVSCGCPASSSYLKFWKEHWVLAEGSRVTDRVSVVD